MVCINNGLYLMNYYSGQSYELKLKKNGDVIGADSESQLIKVNLWITIRFVANQNYR